MPTGMAPKVALMRSNRKARVGSGSPRPTRAWRCAMPESAAESQPVEPVEAQPVGVQARVSPETAVRDSPVDTVKAYAPYLIIIVVFVIATRVSAITGVAPTKPGTGGTGLESATRIYDWPGLHIVSGKGKAVATTFKLNILSAAGTLLLISGLL